MELQRKIKAFDDLEFSDDFMFMTIMHNPTICRGVLERLLGIKIKKIKYHQLQKAIQPYYRGHGIRMDVYCEENGKIYDVEMQNKHYDELEKRTRYYQSMLDTDQLMTGEDYKNLKESFIIFICKNDPFKQGEPVYEVRQIFRNCFDSAGKPLDFKDDVHKIFFNAAAYEKVKDPQLKDFLKFVNTSTADDEFTETIGGNISEAKMREALRSDYMAGALHWYDAKEEGRAEGKSQKALEDAVIAVQLGLDAEVVAEKFGVPLEELNERLALSCEN